MLRMSPTHHSSGALTDRDKRELSNPCFSSSSSGFALARGSFTTVRRRVDGPPLWLGLVAATGRRHSHQPRRLQTRFPPVACETRDSQLALWVWSLGPRLAAVMRLALLPWCTPVEYCNLCPLAASALNARARDGSLPPCIVLFPDTRLVNKEAFLRQVLSGHCRSGR